VSWNGDNSFPTQGTNAGFCFHLRTNSPHIVSFAKGFHGLFGNAELCGDSGITHTLLAKANNLIFLFKCHAFPPLGIWVICDSPSLLEWKWRSDFDEKKHKKIALHGKIRRGHEKVFS